SDLNFIHILYQQLRSRELSADQQRAATNAFFATIDQNRGDWQRLLVELNEELEAFRKSIDRQRTMIAAQPKKWTQAEKDAGRERAAHRESARLDLWMKAERDYRDYTRTLTNL